MAWNPSQKPNITEFLPALDSAGRTKYWKPSTEFTSSRIVDQMAWARAGGAEGGKAGSCGSGKAHILLRP